MNSFEYLFNINFQNFQSFDSFWIFKFLEIETIFKEVTRIYDESPLFCLLTNLLWFHDNYKIHIDKLAQINNLLSKLDKLYSEINVYLVEWSYSSYAFKVPSFHIDYLESMYKSMFEIFNIFKDDY